MLTLNILYTTLMETKPTRFDNKNKKVWFFSIYSRRYRSFLGLSQVLFRLEHNIMNLMEWKQKTKFYVQKDISRYVQGHHDRVWCDIKLIQESSWLPLVHDALHARCHCGIFRETAHFMLLFELFLTYNTYSEIWVFIRIRLIIRY